MSKYNRHKKQRINSPGAISRRVDARRAAIAAGPEPVRDCWRPGAPWYTITVASPGRADVFVAAVPVATGRRRPRSDAWDVTHNGAPLGRMGGSGIGRAVGAVVHARPSIAALSGMHQGYTECDEADAAAC